MKLLLGDEGYSTLAPTCSLKALHLKNVAPQSRVYAPSKESLTQSMVFAPSAVDLQQCPAAFSRCGKGFLGYLGDVNNEEESQALLISLLGKWNLL